jgi:predicted nucleotidyltransferase
MGFSSRWYKDGIQSAMEIELPNKIKIRTFTAPYFIASKIEAYKSRGKNDMRTSPDFEDLIYVLDNRNELIAELNQAEDNRPLAVLTATSRLLSLLVYPCSQIFINDNCVRLVFPSAS